MKKDLYMVLFFLSVIIAACKKKTTITVKVFNPALNEYVEGAVVSLLEIKDPSKLGGLSGADAGCTEIATATTDANGVATFDNEWLRTKSKYRYKCGLKESWGISHQNPCGGQRQKYLDVGKSQEVRLDDYLDIEYKVEYNSSYLNPSISGDSLICEIRPMTYYNSDGIIQGGGGGNYLLFTHDNDYPIISTAYSQITKLFANRFAVTTRKRKMGVVTTTVDTVRAYPGKGVIIIKLDW